MFAMKRDLAFHCLLLMVLLIAATASAPLGTAQAPAGKAAFNGQAIFDDYCAVCHGRDAKGDGPAARALKTPPIDLTQISHDHSGKFPEAEIRKIILGLDMMPSHGTEAMPIWGKVFTKIGDPSTVGQRVDALLVYLRQIQAK
ncbi:MAG: c-type cytochrome [Bryobacteraceae bacterium]